MERFFVVFICSRRTCELVDGLRIDTVKDVEKSFWTTFQAAEPNLYMVGEVADGDVEYVCDYQNHLGAVLNYPMCVFMIDPLAFVRVPLNLMTLRYYQLTQFFETSTATTANLVGQINYLNEVCIRPTLLASFSENHDQPRFPSYTEDMSVRSHLLLATCFDGLTDAVGLTLARQERNRVHAHGRRYPYQCV